MPTVGYVMLASSGPSMTPLNASFDVRPDAADGFRMYQAAPALSGSSVAVLSEPHSLPLAYMTPVNRLSLAFIGPKWVEPAAGATVPPSVACQQASPPKVGWGEGSNRHVSSGVSLAFCATKPGT